MNGWTPDPCTGTAGWTAETVCTSPYDVGLYGVGPYGRCQVLGDALWSEQQPCAPFMAQAPAPHQPWRKAANADLHR